MNPSGNWFSGNTEGILWGLVSTALFTIVAAMAKVAVKDYHVLQILFFRQMVVFVSCLPVVARHYPEALITHHPLGHCLRLTGAFVALSCGLWAVAVLPLTTALTLGFSQAMFVAVLAFCFLREPAGKHRITAIVTGFVGVIVVMRPGVGVFDVHTLIPVLGALGAAVAITSVRKLSQTESTATLLIFQAVFVGLLSSLPLYWLWVSPDLAGLLLLLVIGVLSTAGQWIGIKALRLGEASVVANVQYMQLVYAAILGFAVFDEVPDKYTLGGAVIIIGSAVYLLHRESRSRPDRDN